MQGSAPITTRVWNRDVRSGPPRPLSTPSPVWLLAQPAVTAPIIGPRTQEQLDAALRALDVGLDAATLTRLNEIFPGHQTAPEDYAW